MERERAFGPVGRWHNRVDARHSVKPEGLPPSPYAETRPRISHRPTGRRDLAGHRGSAELALGPYKGKKTGETALFRSLWDRFTAGDIILGDRCFASFFGIAPLVVRGVDGLFRMHQRRKYDFRCGRCLGIEDHVVLWAKPSRPEWMDKALYAQLPEQLEIRELRVKVQRIGFRVAELVLVTTLLDSQGYTKEELADLYLERWNVELDLRSIKCVMQIRVPFVPDTFFFVGIVWVLKPWMPSVSSPVARQSRGARASDSGRYQAGGSDSRRGEISVASRVRPLFAFQDQCAGSMSIVARTAALMIARLTPGVMPYSISRNSRTSSRRSYSPWPRHRLPGNRACRLGFPVCDSMPPFRSRPRLLSGAPDVLRKVPPCLPPDCAGEHRGKAGGPQG